MIQTRTILNDVDTQVLKRDTYLGKAATVDLIHANVSEVDIDTELEYQAYLNEDVTQP